VNPADAAVLDAWWRTFVATGRLPAELPVVQARWIRAVHRGELPSGPVFVKVMTFPRGKDRLRYLLRALPGAHEARLLTAAAAAGLPGPEVVAVRTQRRWLLPHRSLLVLRALAPAPGEQPPLERLGDEADLARRLLAAGIVHRDLHGDNSLRCVDGRLAVLDLQSADLRAAGRMPRRLWVAAAARLWRGRLDLPRDDVAAVFRARGLLAAPAEAAAAHAQAEREHMAWLRSRIARCRQSSTEFVRRLGWRGIEYRRRGDLPPGRWLTGGRRLLRCWIGDRAAAVLTGCAPTFFALRTTWWWLGGGCNLYVPDPCDDLESALRTAEAWLPWEQRVSEAGTWWRTGGKAVGATDGLTGGEPDTRSTESR
jgi:hypothetical protein